MVKITLQTGDISRFSGDALVLPCDTELAFKRVNTTVQKVFERAGPELLKEVLAISYCEIGSVIRTNGYNLGVKHVIFLPYTDHNNPKNMIDSVLLHQSLRCLFTMASLYKIATIGIPLFNLKRKRKSFKEKLFDLEILDIVFNNSHEESLTETEVEDIIMGVSPEFDKQSLQEVVIYK